MEPLINAFQYCKPQMKNFFWIVIALSLSIQHELNAQVDSASENNSSTMSHSHMPISIPDNAPAPALSLDLYADSMSGYNLILRLENYRMTPPPQLPSMSELMTATVDPKTGYVEGHAHLYINGTKIQRLYGESAHLPSKLFITGINHITVTINNHGHMFWSIQETQVLATLFFKHDGTPTIVHQFASFPIQNDQPN